MTLTRMERRGEIKRIQRGEYIFLERKATGVPEKQQKATPSRGGVPPAFLEVSDTQNSNATPSTGTLEGVPVSRRVLAILISNSPKSFTPENLAKRLYNSLKQDFPALRYERVYHSVKKALQRHHKRGLLSKKGGGRYYLSEGNVNKAMDWLDDRKRGVPPRGVSHDALSPRPTHLTVIENRKRIAKAITMDMGEYMETYYAISKIPNIIIRGPYENDPAKQIIAENSVVRFVFSWNRKKNHWKLMIYFPGNPKDPLEYLRYRGLPSFVIERIKAVSIKQDTVMNFDEVLGALIEKHSDELDINFSDFGGDLEHTGEATAGRIFARIIQDAQLAEELAGYKTQIPQLRREIARLSKQYEGILKRIEEKGLDVRFSIEKDYKEDIRALRTSMEQNMTDLKRFVITTHMKTAQDVRSLEEHVKGLTESMVELTDILKKAYGQSAPPGGMYQ